MVTDLEPIPVGPRLDGGIMTAQRMRLAGRQTRLDLLPERRGDAPVIVVRNLPFLSYLTFCWGCFCHRLSPAAYVCRRDLYVNQAYWDRLLFLGPCRERSLDIPWP